MRKLYTGIDFAGATSGVTTLQASAVAGGVALLPALSGTDTLVALAATQNLTNKTINGYYFGGNLVGSNISIGGALLTPSGASNIAFGVAAGASVGAGNDNTSIGTQALANNTIGGRNTAIGSGALYNYNNTTAGGNTGNNTAVGYNTGGGIVTGTFNTILGANVTGLAAGLSNNIIISDGATIRIQFAGAVGTWTGSLAVTSTISASNLSGTNTGDQTLASITGTLAVAKGGTNAGAFTAGSVVFAGTSGTYTQDNANFFWDATNHRLGMGTTSPLERIHLVGTGAIIYTDDSSGNYRHGLYWTSAGGTANNNSLTVKISDGTTTGQATAAVFTGAGRVGIGTAAPDKKLMIVSSTIDDAVRIQAGAVGASQGFAFSNSSGTNIGFMAMVLTTGHFGADTVANDMVFGACNSGAFRIGTSTGGNPTTRLLLTNAGLFGVGVAIGSITVAAQLHSVSTTEQLRLGYNATNYFSTTVASTGSTTFNLTGTSPTFTFSSSSAGFVFDPVNQYFGTLFGTGGGYTLYAEAPSSATGTYMQSGGSTRNDASKNAFVFGSAGVEYFRIDGSFIGHTIGNIGIGVSAPLAKVHVLATTEQLRLSYDSTHYFSTTVGITGTTTFALTGSSPQFSFSQLVNFSSGLVVSGRMSGGTVTTVTYSASITINAALGNYFITTITNTTALTINAPTNPTVGQTIVITLRCSNGSTSGTITWTGGAGGFKTNGPFTVADSGQISWVFYYDGTNWIELTHSANVSL